ncbi:MAG: PH domain-containing protein [Alistipes sp.]|jgi:hypothetical protein|nr:PH domain-containing protein [Alistipes sp.]
MDLENKITSHFHWSPEVIAITCISLCVVLGCLIPLVLAKAPSLLLKWSIIAVVVIPIVYCAAWTPRYIALIDDNLVFKKVVGNITIPIQTINKIYQIDSDTLNGSIRTFGSGGVFGYLGRFKNKVLGNYSMYITERKNLIVVKTNDTTYVFNCNNQQRFISVIETSSDPRN